MIASSTNTAFLTLGNDNQVPLILNLLKSLRDPKRGNFRGITYTISNKLSTRSLNELKKNNIHSLIIPEETWKPWAEKLKSDSHPFGKIAKLALVNAALTFLPNTCEYFVFSDPDVICQDSIDSLFELIDTYSVKFAKEPIDLKSNPTLEKRLLRGCRVKGDPQDYIDRYTYEINTGIFAASIASGRNLLDKFVRWQLSDDWHNFAQKDSERVGGWHDQDFFRFYRIAENPDNIGDIPIEIVFHLVAWANIASQWNSTKRKLEVTEAFIKPTLIHFAGGAQRAFTACQNDHDSSRSDA